MLTNGRITIYHKAYDKSTRKDVWTKAQIDAVNWYGSQMVTVTDNGLTSANKYTVRIPTSANLDIAVGDIIARGFSKEEISLKSQIAALHSESFTITAIADNRRGGGQHWRIEGA